MHQGRSSTGFISIRNASAAGSRSALMCTTYDSRSLKTPMFETVEGDRWSLTWKTSQDTDVWDGWGWSVIANLEDLTRHWCVRQLRVISDADLEDLTRHWCLRQLRVIGDADLEDLTSLLMTSWSVAVEIWAVAWWQATELNERH